MTWCIKNICMRGVQNPIAISPYYTNQTVEPFEDPKYEGDKIPDYKGITLENIFSETPGDVLIAGLERGASDGGDAEECRDQGDHAGAGAPGLCGHHAEGQRNELCADGQEREGDGKAADGEAPRPMPCAGKFVPMQ